MNTRMDNADGADKRERYMRTHPGKDIEDQVLYDAHHRLETMSDERWYGKQPSEGEVSHPPWSGHYQWCKVFDKPFGTRDAPSLAWKLCVVNRLEQIPILERKVEKLQQTLSETTHELNSLRDEFRNFRRSIRGCASTPLSTAYLSICSTPLSLCSTPLSFCSTPVSFSASGASAPSPSASGPSGSTRPSLLDLSISCPLAFPHKITPPLPATPVPAVAAASPRRLSPIPQRQKKPSPLQLGGQLALLIR